MSHSTGVNQPAALGAKHPVADTAHQKISDCQDIRISGGQLVLYCGESEDDDKVRSHVFRAVEQDVSHVSSHELRKPTHSCTV